LAEDLTPDAYETIRQLMTLVAENGLSELTVTQSDGFSVTVKASSSEPETTLLQLPFSSVPSLPYMPPAPLAGKPAAESRLDPDRRTASAIAMGSPMVGIFYEAPGPGESPFIQVGDVIQIGSIIGLIEAMKVYSEVPSEVAGRVVEIPAKNGVLVQQGEPLLYVEPL
jgi:acetyl-CoA carboxylase biotin carboxyl carrier protein